MPLGKEALETFKRDGLFVMGLGQTISQNNVYCLEWGM